MAQSITVYILMLHPHASRILLVPDSDGWTLPHFTREQWGLWSCVNDVNATMQRQYGITCSTLRCHEIGVNEAGDWLVYACEPVNRQGTLPAGCRWASPDEIVSQALLPPDLSACVRSWDTWEGRVDARRVPWYQRGWAPPAVAWMTRQLDALGLAMTAAPRQLRTCQRSTVWEIPAGESSLYFKAVPPYFRHEIALTEYLMAQFPRDIPRILATELSQGWMLMVAAGDHPLDGASGLEAWCAALQRYAEIQVAVSAQADQVIARGCPALPPAQLGDGMQKLLADHEALIPVDRGYQLTAEERQRLRECHQHIAAMGRRLAVAPIPLSLDHGDFWSAQILLHHATPVIIDWSDACVTMPFFSLFKYLIPQKGSAQFHATIDAEDRLRDAYLDPWTAFASRDQLLDIYHQARRLASLHYAIYTSHHLSPQMEVRWEQGNMVPYFLKRLAATW